MRVETGKQPAAGQPGSAGRVPPAEGAGNHVECRALVATAPAAAPQRRMLPRQATFLAHLIATRQQAPQTRERRRAEPCEALAAYRAAAGLIGG